MKRIKIIYLPVFFILFIPGLCRSQAISNLEVIHSLIDLSADAVSGNVTDPGRSYSLSFNSIDDYAYLQNRLIAQLSSERNINIDSLNNSSRIIFNLDYAGVKYSDTFKDGVFGGFMLARKAEIKGSYQIVDELNISFSDMIEFSAADTISYDDLGFVEQAGLPFTRGELPPEPFLPSLVEPLIAVGAVVITIILFFTVRTK